MFANFRVLLWITDYPVSDISISLDHSIRKYAIKSINVFIRNVQDLVDMAYGLLFKWLCENSV